MQIVRKNDENAKQHRQENSKNHAKSGENNAAQSYESAWSVALHQQ
jgi:hypothetical protein